VVGYDNIKKWFRIKYTDGDTEEMSRTELKKSINAFQQQFIIRKQTT
jgi:hypothetical protein